MNGTNLPPPEEVEDEVAALIKTLHETEQRLAELTGVEADPVSSESDHAILLRHAQVELLNTEAVEQAAILNGLPAQIALLNAQGRIISVNEAWRQFASANFLQGPEFAVGVNYLEICDRAKGVAAEAGQAAGGIRAVLAGAKTFSLEYPCHSPTERRWFLMTVTPLIGAQTHGVVVMHLNITERRLAENAVRESEAAMAAAQQIGHFGSWEIDLFGAGDPDAGTLRWSDEMFRIAGYEPGAVEITNQFFFSRVPPEEHEAIRQGVERAIRERKQYSAVHRLIRADGEMRVVQETAQIYYETQTGRALKIIGTAHDITERTVIRVALAREHNLLRMLIDNLPACIYVKDLEGRIMVYNQAAVRQMGLKAESEALGKTVFDFFPPEIARLYKADDDQVRRSGQMIQDREEPTQDHAGNPLWYLTTKLPLRDASGVFGVLGISQDITERKKTEAALRESEEHFRLLTALADAMRPLSDPEEIMAIATRMLGEHLDASRCAYAAVEKDQERFTILHDYTDGCASTVGSYRLSRFGKRALAVLHSGKTLIIRDVDAELLPEEGANEFNAIGIKAIISCPLIGDNGLHALMAVHQTAPRDWQPREIALVQEVVARCWATIERRTAEENLRKSESMLRIAGRTARFGGWTVELPDFRATWSDEVCAIHEVPSGTVPTLRQAIGFYTPQSRERISEVFRKCAENGTPFDLELEIITAKGKLLGVRAIGEAEYNAAGAIARVQGAFQDITERKKIADELRASEKRFKALFEQAAVGVAQTDATTGRFVQVNRRFCEILGRSREELEQLTFASLTHSQDVALSLDMARQIKAGPQREFTEEKRYLRKDGAEVWANVTISAMWSPGDVPDYFIAVVQDVTGRKKLEEQFRQTQKMEAIGTLAGGIAHDFNNILAAINGYAELAKMRLAGNPEVRDYLGAVLQASSRATDLVRQILTFSRQEKLARRPTQLLPIVTEALKLLRASIPTTIEFDILLKDVPPVLADETQIHQVLMNLGTNAWHAMKDRPGRLQVKLERSEIDASSVSAQVRLKPGDYARLSVSDTGSGMNQETLKRIFEPFFTTKPTGEGTGLGLAVVHGIMATHDGAVTVYSEPGEGTVFHLYFPAFAGEVVAVIDLGDVPRGHGERILFVDDEELLVRLGEKTLTSLGYVVEGTTQPVAALAMVRADPQRFALVLTDQTMPGMTGMDLSRQLLELRPGLPIILLTGYGLSLTSERTKAAGICDLLIKPTTIHSLGSAVNAALSTNPKKQNG